MRTRELLEGVPVFLAVAEARSFTRGAKRLGISPSAASQAVRSLEARIGTPLLSRSTRSLSLTSAGEAYLRKVSPAFATIEDATKEAMGRTSQPSGLLRLTMPRAAYDGVVGPALFEFRRRFPLIEFEIEIEGGLVDIAEKGFDAGLRYGDLLAKDMETVEVLGASVAVLVAAPTYLADHPALTEPAELARHEAVVCRSRTTGVISSWLLKCGDRSWRHDPDKPTIAGDLAMQIDLTVGGHGVSCTPIQCALAALEAGRLTRVLPDWTVPLQPIHLYHPRRGTANPALQTFVAYLQMRHVAPSRSPASNPGSQSPANRCLSSMLTDAVECEIGSY